MTDPAPANVTVNGPKIRRLRQLAGKSVSALANEAGISIQYLSFLEREDRERMSPEKFAALCDALGVKDRAQLIKPHDAEAVA